MNLFIIRLFLAISFYVCIPFVSYSSALAGMILVAGYRSLLALSPYFTSLFGSRDLRYATILALTGVLLFFMAQFHAVGALMMAAGLSVGGFILKAIASETPSTSALNKIAITSGNIGAGVILLLTGNKTVTSVAIIVILLSLTLLMKAPETHKRQNIKALSLAEVYDNASSHLVWFCFGIAIGVRVFGMYIILPSYLNKTLGYMPEWYGLTFVVYGLAVILTQIPALCKGRSFSLTTSIVALALSCIIMGLPNLFYAETLVGALLWCLCLALEEVFAPYIDFHAAQANHLLTKEISIGIGGAFCFLWTQTSLPTEFLGLASLLFITAGFGFYRKVINNRAPSSVSNAG